jgi:hypothetical protein
MSRPYPSPPEVFPQPTSLSSLFLACLLHLFEGECMLQTYINSAYLMAWSNKCLL